MFLDRRAADPAKGCCRRGPRVEMRVFRIAGLGESNVEEMVGEALLALGLELGYCARPGEVDLRTIGAPEVLDDAARIIVEKLGPHIVTRDQRTLEKVVVDAADRARARHSPSRSPAPAVSSPIA